MFDRWQWVNPRPQGNEISAFACGENVCVAAGGDGAILLSTNFNDWIPVPSFTRSWLSDVAYGNGRFITVGSQGVILYSTNGFVWESSECPSNINLHTVCYSDGLFVVGGEQGLILTSTGGLQWSPHWLDTTRPVTDIAYGDGMFVAVDGLNVFSSATGTNWTWRYQSFTQPSRVAFGAGQFLALGQAGGILQSTNGESWDRQDKPATTAVSWVSYENGLFVAVGSSNGIGVCQTSRDGTTWTNTVPPIFRGFNSVVATSNTIVLGGIAGGLVRSSNFVDWVSLRTGPTEDLYSISGSDDLIVAVGGRPGVSQVLISSNGSAWTKVSAVPMEQLSSVVYGADLFVAAGSKIYYSTNGQEWFPASGAGPCTQIAYGAGVFIAVSRSTLFRSTNGITWDAVSPGYGFWETVTYGNGKFVIGGSGGSIATSPDGAAWTARDSGNDHSLKASAYGNGTFVLVGINGAWNSPLPTDYYGVILTSTNGIEWVKRGFDDLHWGLSLAFGGGKFVCSGEMFGNYRPFVLSSTNGIMWETEDWNSKFLGICFYKGDFYGVGYYGTIAKSAGAAAAITNARIDNGGSFAMELHGTHGNRYMIQSSPDLLHWRKAGYVTIGESDSRFTDPSPTNSARQFYRIQNP